MPLSWNEIKARALAFSKEWETESSEDAEAKSFWDDFFNVFGVHRRRVATFETPVKKGDSKQGFIDLLWKGVILVEHKSRGRSLEKAAQQARDYFPGLKDHELPRYILVSDFALFRLYDLEAGAETQFALADFVNHVHLFDFLAGYEKRAYKEEDPVNIKAAELMGRLHDWLEESGYTGRDLELYLVRLLFCLFADDTNIFEKGIFWQYLDQKTNPDGSDLGLHLHVIFQTLNTPRENRQRSLDENLALFPYVNGHLFADQLAVASFDSKTREMLLQACGLNWAQISPAIFGSMFQAAMNPKERRNLGAHYTSEKNIQKVIRPLFLDDLYAEFEKAKGSRPRLTELHSRIATLHFLDPACGCGNFLIISYRELRQLEISILRELHKGGQQFLDVREIIRVDVDQFAGIEYDEFAARIAEVAMWLVDHQMNMRVSEEFGQFFVRLPLRKAAKIVHGNALWLDWFEVVSKDKLDYILGNPPFIGAMWLDESQRRDIDHVFNGFKGAGILDYVACWYYLASKYIQNSEIKVAFVSTNSISQGEQAGIFWPYLFNSLNIKFHFAHRTFRWSNEAKGNAAVHCVIIGFGIKDVPEKYLFEYEGLKGQPHLIKVKNINAYLVDAPNLVIAPRKEPVCAVPKMVWGSQPRDGGYFLMDKSEMETLLMKEPGAAKWVRRFIGGYEFLNNKDRFCLWLVGISPTELKSLPEIIKRVDGVRKFRLSSKAPSTKKMSETPTLFAQIAHTGSDYLAVPEVSSERRKYIPMGFVQGSVIASNKIQMIPNASVFLFGALSSEMHNTWVRYTCGRLKSDYSYSNSLVYNNFPFPTNPTDAQKKRVEEAAQTVLDTRAKYPGSSLADLYDPVTMPPDLVKAHQALDKAVDLCYRPQPFASELSRIEFLFGLYEQYTAPMFNEVKPKLAKSKKA